MDRVPCFRCSVLVLSLCSMNSWLLLTGLPMMGRPDVEAPRWGSLTNPSCPAGENERPNSRPMKKLYGYVQVRGGPKKWGSDTPPPPLGIHISVLQIPFYTGGPDKLLVSHHAESKVDCDAMRTGDRTF